MFTVAPRSEADRFLSGMTLAFVADPFVRWLYPQPDAYLAHFPYVADLFGGRAFERGTAYRNEDFSAAALWLPPEVHPDGDGLVACFKETVAAEKLDDLLSTFEQMDRFHPADPCWHLAFIAVDPKCQGKGLGAALLEESLRLCDRDGRAAYLESTNPANLSLYRRSGFEQIGLIQSGSAPPLYPMLRPPH